jgi:RHS repeat-associated protein
MIKQGTNENLYFTETDHLGSIISLLDESGTYVEKYLYDPWGRRRNPVTWSYDSIPAPTLIDRGFTGHEHLDEFGLINMNGRMYDPYIGRFLSVDPIIQFPGNSQSFNGYGYCLNNPLSYSDPSGMLVAPPDLDVGAIDQYFSLMTDINWGMNISVGGGHSYSYDREKKWYFDENGKAIDWETYINEIAEHAPEIAAQLKKEREQTSGIKWNNPYFLFTGKRVLGKRRVEGTLTLYNKTQYGIYKTIHIWSAGSGNISKWPIPQGNWFVSHWRERYERGFTNWGVGFSFDITPDPWFHRGSFRIHSDGPPINSTGGCIGLTGDRWELELFQRLTREILDTQENILLEVDYGLPIIQIYP